MQYKASRRKYTEVFHRFCRTDDVILCNSGTKQICQLLRASMVASACNSKDGRLMEQVMFSYHDRMISVTLLSGNRFWLLILEYNWRKHRVVFYVYDHLSYLCGHSFISLPVDLHWLVTEKDSDGNSGLPLRNTEKLLYAALSEGLEGAI